MIRLPLPPKVPVRQKAAKEKPGDRRKDPHWSPISGLDMRQKVTKKQLGRGWTSHSGAHSLALDPPSELNTGPDQRTPVYGEQKGTQVTLLM